MTGVDRHAIATFPNVCMHMCVSCVFYNVCTVDKWRVVLKGETPDYINASSINVSSSTKNIYEKKTSILYHKHIKSLCPILSHWQGYKCQRAFIITQGPMSSTARDFWKMVHDRKSGVIVMLSNLLEENEVMEKDSWREGRIL